MLRHWFKENGEAVGILFLALGILLIFVAFIFTLMDTEVIYLLSLGLASISAGLGLISIGASAKSDSRHTELLESLDKNVARLPLMLKGDVLSPSGQLIAKEMISEQSKIAAQKRLDEDTKRVGVLRGEIYQLEDGSWAIHWGGKYPL